MNKNPKVLIVLGLVFLLVTVIIPVVALMPLLSKSDDTEVIFKTPGSAEISITEPGRYYLWNAYETIFEGTSYKRPSTLPDGLSLSIETTSGKQLPLSNDSSITFTSGAESKQSVGHVEITEPVDLVITATGTTDEVDARILVFSQSIFAGNMRKIVVCVILTVMCAITAMVLLIWGVIIIANNRGKSPASTPIR